MEARDAGSDLHVLAMPLSYIYDRRVLVFDSAAPSKRPLENFVAWAATRYDNLWFLGGGGTDLLTARVAAEPVASEIFQVPEYAATLNAYPNGVRRKEFEYGLYRLTPSEAPLVGPQTLEIGVRDDLNVVRFHAKERRPADGTTFRWTGPRSFVLLQGIAADAKELTIWMGDGGRPPQAPAAIVEIMLDNERLGTATPVDAILPYRFALPSDLARRLGAEPDPARLSLRVQTWSPAAILGVSDTRELGVMVARVEVR